MPKSISRKEKIKKAAKDRKIEVQSQKIRKMQMKVENFEERLNKLEKGNKGQ